MDKELKPKIVNDIGKYELFREKDRVTYTIGSIKKDRFIMASDFNVDDIMEVYRLFDGEHTLQQIINTFHTKNKEIDVGKLLKIAEEAGLVESKTQQKIVLNEFQKYGFSLIDIRINEIYKKVFQSIAKIINGISAVLIVVLITIMFLLLPRFGSQIVKLNIYGIFNSAFLSLILSTFVTTISVLIHELAHAVVAAKYGLLAKKISISIYLFTPIIYITIPGIYTLSRRKRLLIHSAGILSNMVIFSLSTITLVFSKGTLREVMLLIAFNNLGLIVMNLVPFLPLDGYFILMNILKIPNLRKVSAKKVISIIKDKKSKFIVYGIYNIISIVFIVIVVASIIFQVVYNFNLGWHSNNSIIAGIIEIRGYLVIFIVMIVSKIINYKKERNIYGKGN